MDNTTAIKWANDTEGYTHKTSKTIDIHHHYLRQLITDGEIQLLKIPTQDNIADIFTKPLNGQTFLKFREQMSMRDLPHEDGYE